MSKMFQNAFVVSGKNPNKPKFNTREAKALIQDFIDNELDTEYGNLEFTVSTDSTIYNGNFNAYLYVEINGVMIGYDERVRKNDWLATMFNDGVAITIDDVSEMGLSDIDVENLNKIMSYLTYDECKGNYDGLSFYNVKTSDYQNYSL